MDNMRVANGGTKRRLPLWMSGDQGQRKSEAVNLNNRDEDKGCQEDEERVTKGNRRPKPKSQKKETDDGKAKLKESSSTVLVKCQERKKTRREMMIQDADISEDGARKKRKCRQKTETYFESETNEDVELCMEDGEIEDLTVEDLMSIAKEYVKEDNDAQVLVPSQQRDAAAENRSKYVEEDNNAQVLVPPKQRDSAENRSRNDVQPDSFVGVTDTSRSLFESQGTSSCSTTENPASDKGVPVALSANPIQDMLDVFLGSLLKKTQKLEKENRRNSENTSSTYELEKQHSSADVAEEPIVVVKKKSSLKDKVAMLFD